jgi:hypothetical protein
MDDPAGELYGVDGPVFFAARLGAGWGDWAVGGCGWSGALLALCIDLFGTKTVGMASGVAGMIAWSGGMRFAFRNGTSAGV